MHSLVKQHELANTVCKALGPGITWPLYESNRKYRKGLRLINHLGESQPCLQVMFMYITFGLLQSYGISSLLPCMHSGLRITFAFCTADENTSL